MLTTMMMITPMWKQMVNKVHNHFLFLNEYVLWLEFIPQICPVRKSYQNVTVMSSQNQNQFPILTQIYF